VHSAGFECASAPIGSVPVDGLEIVALAKRILDRERFLNFEAHVFAIDDPHGSGGRLRKATYRLRGHLWSPKRAQRWAGTADALPAEAGPRR
jgi:hypothetical protein